MSVTQTEPMVITHRLERTAAEAAELRERARQMLIEVVADAHQLGFTQREIAKSLGRSQPEISRLLSLSPPRFMPTTELGRHLVRKRSEIEMAVENAGAGNIRVFGSVARGEDGPDSDIDLLIDMPDDYTLMDLAGIQVEVHEILSHPVDVVPANDLQPKKHKQIHMEAIAL